MHSEETITLFRPVGPVELELIRRGGFSRLLKKRDLN
jgi:hypothetical protein